MIKITENPGEGLGVQGKGEGLERKLCKTEILKDSFFLSDFNGKHIPKHIEDILIENGFERNEMQYCSDLYKREYNGTTDVFLYEKGYPQKGINPKMTLVRASRWEMRMAKVFRTDVVKHSLSKIRTYNEGKEENKSLLEILLCNAIWSANVLGPMFVVANGFLSKNMPNYQNLWLVVYGFVEGGVAGTVIWRAYWGIHNRRFKEGEKAMEYIQNGRVSQEAYQAKAKAITQPARPYSEEITV